MHPGSIASSDSVSSVPGPEAKLRRLSPAARVNYSLFMESGDEQALAALVFEVLGFYLPKEKAPRQAADWKDECRLVEDLGFDSLAIIETVFFFEELLQVSISNDELIKLKTVGELRQFLREKVKAGRA